MEEGVLPVNTGIGTPSDAYRELDCMDELLLQGCWLETNGSEFPHFDASTPISLFESSFPWPALEADSVEFGKSTLKEERQHQSFPENDVSVSQDQDSLVVSPFQSENYTVGGSESSKRWWIGPAASTSVIDRLIQALGYIKELSKDNKDILIQVWVPVVDRGGQRVLTTNNQPFSLDLNCPSLAHYREISINFQFPAEEDSKEGVGLPGRVFRNKVPEWTPDVKFFNSDEYPRVGHAHQYDISGTLAVPVLERGTRNCLGVIEVILTKQKSRYRPELESVCKALEAVDLGSSEAPSTQNDKTCDLSYQTIVPEIVELLQAACRRHGLPLAQTWIPCILQGKGGCRHSNENLENCVSTLDSACYIGDSRFKGFHEASSDYHLLKGQGIVGKAFRTNQPCFAPDVTSYSKTEYPLSHHARMFGLLAAVAIRLRSICTSSADFVLEFFLPVSCRNPEDQKKMLNSLSTTIQDVCQTLRVVKDEELQEKSAPPSDKLANSPVIMRFSSVPKVEQIHQESYQPGSHSRGVTYDAITCTSGDGSLTQTSKRGEKRRTKADKNITLQILRQHFAGSLKDAARNLGVCPTTLKRICRQHGIQRWPSRKIKKVGHSLQKIQRVIDSVQGAAGVLQIESFYSNFPELASPSVPRKSHFSNLKSTKPLDVHSENRILSPPATTSVSPSSSCSQSSSSSQCWSTGTQTNSYPFSLASNKNSVEDYDDGMLKRARSDAHLLISPDEPKLLQRSQSHLSFDTDAKPESLPATDGGSLKSQERNGPRVKVAFGEEKIRFRMQNSWGHADLLQEICRRFGVDDASSYLLKYLDDDKEWVLLTCDADLEECISICISSRCDTIKFSFLHDSYSQSVTPSSVGGYLF